MQTTVETKYGGKFVAKIYPGQTTGVDVLIDTTTTETWIGEEFYDREATASDDFEVGSETKNSYHGIEDAKGVFVNDIICVTLSSCHKYEWFHFAKNANWNNST